MPSSPVASDVNEPFDVLCDFATQISLNLIVALNVVAQSRQFLVTEFPQFPHGVNPDGFTGFDCQSSPYTVDVGQSHEQSLVVWDVNAGNSRHFSVTSLALPLFVFWALANDINAPPSPNDFALVAHLLDRRSHLHLSSPPASDLTVTLFGKRFALWLGRKAKFQP